MIGDSLFVNRNCENLLKTIQELVKQENVENLMNSLKKRLIKKPSNLAQILEIHYRLKMILIHYQTRKD